VIFRPGFNRAFVSLVMFVILAGPVVGQEKTVRLRHGSIRTPPRSATVAPGVVDERLEGLFLIQFEANLEPAWREQLAALQVELLAYVPDDAFVARCRASSARDVRALPFVRWLDRYRPEQKMPPEFANNRGRPPGPETAASVLVDPGATPADLARLRGFFRTIHNESQGRCGLIISGRIPAARWTDVAASMAVLWLEPSFHPRLTDESSSGLVGGPPTNHVIFTKALGFDGSGVVVAVADTGLDRGTLTNHTELLGRTKALLYYGNLLNAVDEHGHGTHVAGIISGSGITLEGDIYGYYGLGVAPGSQLVIQRIFDAQGGFEPPAQLRTLAEDAVRHGAIVGNNSWVQDTQGRYDLNAMQYDEFVRDADLAAPGDQALLLVFSAGNAGPGSQTIGSPAVAKNVIAVGASQGPRTSFFTYNEGPTALASFSSRGPCEDGRIKPDLVAPGTWIASLLSRSGRVDNAWAPLNDEFALMGGTSQAAPHVSGAAAVFIQNYRSNFNGATPSPALVKAALINSAMDLSGPSLGAEIPNMEEGWGRANVASLVRPDRTFEFVEQGTPLVTGQVYERAIVVSQTNLPLRITLAYTDYPGFPAAVPALVNDLDLELTGPDGRQYRGNQFEQGESLPGARSRDALNNIEGISLSKPLGGEYTLRVRAQSVVQDSRKDTTNRDQDFALVISGGTPAPGEGVLLVDRTAYRAPAGIAVKLFDRDLPPQATPTITARSRTEPDGLLFNLVPSGASGTFTGLVETALGSVAIVDSRLQVSQGDWIHLEYYDASRQALRVAMAMTDLIPPAISGVGVTNLFGQRLVAWRTEEPATSVVYFGLTPDTMSQSISNSSLATSHSVELNGLTPGQTYYFIVVSTDAAGNASTNRNGIVPHEITPTVNATVLVVDAYEPDPADEIIPLSAYTMPLTECGVTYDVWSLAEQHFLPDLAVLRPYPIVLWRVNDSFRRPNDSIPSAQQLAIRQYLDAGGAFFLSSMNILSRLLNQGGGAFVTNVLHVQRFVLNPNQFQHCDNCDEDFRVPLARGVPSDPIGNVLYFTLDYSAYSADGLMGPDFGDTFTASTNAAAILVEDVSGKTCGVRFPRTGEDSSGRVVFVSTALDAIPASGVSPNNRTDFMRRVIQFLSPGVGGAGTLALNQERYTVPDLVTIEMADSDLAGQGAATVRAYSDSNAARVPVTLAETGRPGLFRGVVPLADPGGAVPAGGVPALDGDVIHVEYDDASSMTTSEAMATIDTVKPEVNDLAIHAGYFDATLTWTTSEPTDALAQFGESAFLGRTEYRADRRTTHSLRLIGLVPERTYYLKLAVRDAAGNITTAEDGSEPFIFQTLAPRRPPFFDDLENLSFMTNWTVLNTDDSQREWSVGPPNDNHTAIAFSGLNVWASNLYGDPADVIDTYLISPGLDLRGANVAELRFQHDFNFLSGTEFDLVNRGCLLISTNVQTDPLLLAEYTGSIPDWEEQVIDLTPHAGRIVFLIWHHQLRSASPNPPLERPGWALDDIRVTASNVPGGTILVTNNISQARFTVRRGGLVHSGQGYLGVFTNLPPGTYVVVFDEVSYYVTPPAQTNTLVSGGIILVSGNYTFADANHNGMSDDWELARFGEINPLRSAQWDTDVDGFTDLAEFIAGTNPIQGDSYLALADPFPLSASLVRFSWPSAPGRAYQLQGRSGTDPWIPLSGWIRPPGDVATVTRPPPSVDSFFYRVEVRP
jgi:hypothetical protein